MLVNVIKTLITTINRLEIVHKRIWICIKQRKED